ncbi:bifunctional DNA-formamidopyrimidine glycosylase/DNA-(apurinic or apyrimidinic site) lyase [Rhizobium bangladeshense]|uniref:bifunctional DNA-formamidopyrimidine glycosylase/DNA-(apurinic or apyrimidinic site) lyase n=1 Tax=Rhizobium bangladeshense TaxID=1138189 RepID=UPI0007E5A8D1|nr:bifunctional DNA-formamidopyrimidine glycosylase/DNA-(apurinic or apyrimidinic site) lyase [Rhizobium bangladeshense]MBX4932824.1 bifunctional DNA-formamidopyrimidine glycosylase/DNA-(apurinic or apyrimidinic site) lyase [Rhizobium bangladeshense]MBY3580120.1 bifunctional DNA-formamidopyrimidine glycosylase/DNA-(apurinic or apyrimidinic site) lyase [Rhizobium bangladeshense]MBY3596370.1 bifunctional DNA-formamidopyrimidine glycosylase/DNA-(apurinic or apyrimidinic site) lyase [Rhizobium bangl
MPELPEVETVRRGLAPAMEGAFIAELELRRRDLRFPFPNALADRVSGRTIVGLGRRAKYLLVDLDDGNTLISHLGMSGSFRIEEGAASAMPGEFHHARSKDEKHDHVVFHLQGPNGARRVIYNDPRRFGFMDMVGRADLAAHPFFRDLGPEPTGNELGAAYLAERFRDKAQPLKSALLDQKNIAGLGNIYVCEALWRAHLSPLRAAGTLVTRGGRPKQQLDLLVVSIRDVIADAIAAGGSSLRDHIQADGSLGYFQHSFSVYDREGEACGTPGCGGTVARIVQAGRSTFYCAACQK